jgi:mRNA-degrading endonuclease RelE of RelBE toxin-antitoxin system
MSPRRVRFAAGFNRSYQRLPAATQRMTEEAVAAFIDRSREHALRPERKAGLRGIWTFRVDLDLRVFYTQERDADGRRVSELFHVGKHDDYRLISRRHR